MTTGAIKTSRHVQASILVKSVKRPYALDCTYSLGYVNELEWIVSREKSYREVN